MNGSSCASTCSWRRSARRLSPALRLARPSVEEYLTPRGSRRAAGLRHFSPRFYRRSSIWLWLLAGQGRTTRGAAPPPQRARHLSPTFRPDYTSARAHPPTPGEYATGQTLTSGPRPSLPSELHSSSHARLAVVTFGNVQRSRTAPDGRFTAAYTVGSTPGDHALLQIAHAETVVMTELGFLTGAVRCSRRRRRTSRAVLGQTAPRFA